MKNKTLYAMITILIVWYLMYLVVQSPIVPSPYKTIKTFMFLLPHTLAPHLLSSLFRIIIAVIISLVLGIFIGLILGMNPRIDSLISPIIYLLYPVPKIAFLPVLMILFGIGNLSKVILIIIIIIFQIIVTTRDGVKDIEQELFYSVRSLKMSSFQVYRHLVIPAVAVPILTALRISIGTSIAVLFFAENFATEVGIGYFIMNSWIRVNYVEMFGGILALSLMGLGLFKLIDLIENKFCSWVKIRE